MAEFGANATGTYETPNFIRPQEGVQDRSAEGFLRAAGSAVGQGVELASAFEGREFRGDIDAAVNQEIGKNILATQEAQPSDTQEFKDAVERAKQVYAQGGAGARMRTNLLAEKLTREKAGANPLFANVYRQVAKEVLSDYDATLQFWTAAEESAARQMQSEAADKNTFVKSVYRMHERAGGLVPFTKPPEMMTSQELQDYIVVAGRVAAAKADEARQREILLDGFNLRRTIAAEQGAASNIAGANIALEQRRLETLEVGDANSVQTSFDSEFDSSMIREILNRVANGELSTLSPEFKAEVLNRQSAMRSRVNQQLNTGGYTTDAGMRRADNVRSHMETRFGELEKLVNGPFSELQAYADLWENVQNRLGVEAIEIAPELALAQRVLGPQALSNVLSDLTMGDNDLKRDVTTSVSAAMKNLVTSATRMQANKGDLSRIPEQDAAQLRRNALKRAASADPREAALITNPEQFGINFIAGTDAIEVRGATLSGTEIGFLLNGLMTRSFTEQYEALKTTDPSQAMRVADRYHDAARYVAPAALNTLQSKVGDTETTPEGYFVSDLPDMRVRTLVTQMNSILDGLVLTKNQDKRAPKDDTQARLFFLEKFFGIRKQQVEEAPQ